MKRLIIRKLINDSIIKRKLCKIRQYTDRKFEIIYLKNILCKINLHNYCLTIY